MHRSVRTSLLPKRRGSWRTATHLLPIEDGLRKMVAYAEETPGRHTSSSFIVAQFMWPRVQLMGNRARVHSNRVQGHEHSLWIPQDKNHRVTSQEHLANEPLFIHWARFLPFSRSWDLVPCRKERQSTRNNSHAHSVRGAASARRRARVRTSVHISFTFSKIMLQCLSKALTLANSFRLFLQLIKTCVLALTLDVSTESGPARKAESSSLVVAGSLSVAIVRSYGQPSARLLCNASDPFVRLPHLIFRVALRLTRLEKQLGFCARASSHVLPLSSFDLTRSKMRGPCEDRDASDPDGPRWFRCRCRCRQTTRMELVDYASDSSGEEGVERSEKEGVQVGTVLPRAEEAIAGTLGGEKRKQGFRNSPDVVAKATKTKQESYAKTTASNVMLPPQVRGKKNIVTEDLEKMGLKVKRTQNK